ncbi:MAG: hypothetical protein ACAH88_18360 [Roseimicrobium sp.]
MPEDWTWHESIPNHSRRDYLCQARCVPWWHEEGEPDKGVKFSGQSQLTRKWKLKMGDIIVALDGVHVENFPQYDLVRSLKPATAPLGLIIWDGAQYREVSAEVPDRRFGCAMGIYER